MKIELFKPENEELQKYIDSFYMLTHAQDEDRISYLTFPSLFSVVAVVRKAENIVTPETITTKASAKQPLETSIVCRFNKPICFQYEGDIKEVCIYFKPLGLNAFLPRPLSTYSNSSFDQFVPFSDYESSMIDILETTDQQVLAAQLEHYWANKLVGFEHPFLRDAVHQIHENPQVTTADLANAYGISQKTLIHHFKKHLCKTPTEFKKIRRFRKALQEQQHLGKGTKLTELGYITDFFDQSHMIANFKALTGHTPKSFFQNLSTPTGSQISWIFTEG